MAIRQISQTITGSTDFTDLKEEVTRNARGLNTISLSNYSADTAPVVKVGSVFENNNVTFLVETGDETPTSYAGLTNSTTFYLYYDETGEVFIYSNTAPTWSDALQGYYNGNDRAFFSMYKNSGGTLYQNKVSLRHKSEDRSNNNVNAESITLMVKVVNIGDWDMNATDNVNVAHGITDFKKIRSVAVAIRNDADLTVYLTPTSGGISSGGSAIHSRADATNVIINRLTGSPFDGANFDSTSYNRGWVSITYEI